MCYGLPMDTDTSTPNINSNDVIKGTTLLFPTWQGPTVTDQARTVAAVVEYPANRVLYFQEGGYGIVGRDITLKLVAA